MHKLNTRRVLRYVSRLGLGPSLQGMRMLGDSGRLVSVQIPGVVHPVWARAGSSDVETFEEVFFGREYDLPFDNLEPRAILDVGANVGYASIAFASRWPDARILAVEPDARNLEVLKLNVRPWRRITPLRAALWPRSAPVRIANPGAAFNEFYVGESDDGRDGCIPGLGMGDLIDLLNCESLDLLKLDVEGAEAGLFRGDCGWLDQIGVMVVELHDRLVPGCAQALFGALRGRRFRQEIIGRNLAFDFR